MTARLENGCNRRILLVELSQKGRNSSREGGVCMKVNLLTDETVLVYHEQIRDQVALDASSDGKQRLMGMAARERANTLLDELRRRRFVVSPIEWPDRHDGEK